MTDTRRHPPPRPACRRAAAAALAIAGVLAAVPLPAAADCTCRSAGESLPLGTTACLSVAGRTALYRCEMNLNITSWRRVGEICPVASLALPPVPGGGAADHDGPRRWLR